jgi:hypothetical protein
MEYTHLSVLSFYNFNKVSDNKWSSEILEGNGPVVVEKKDNTFTISYGGVTPYQVYKIVEELKKTAG